MIISRTPFRISFLGGGTDYPLWYKEHQGATLGTSIDKYCFISLRRLPPFFEYQSRIVWSQIELVNSIGRINHPNIRECLKFMGIDCGIEVHHFADLPARSGLGSSSAFTVGMLNALYAFKRLKVSKSKLAGEAIKIEREILKENIGDQDQILCATGGFNLICFPEDGEPTVEVVNPFNLEDYVMLFFTGFARNATDMAGEQLAKLSENRRELCHIYKLVWIGLACLKNQDFISFGKVLDETWRLKRSLTNHISNPSIDYIYDRAKKAGAIGGKLLGAGGGGFMVFIIEPEKQQTVREALPEILEVPVKFEKEGTRIIVNDGISNS